MDKTDTSSEIDRIVKRLVALLDAAPEHIIQLARCTVQLNDAEESLALAEFNALSATENTGKNEYERTLQRQKVLNGNEAYCNAKEVVRTIKNEMVMATSIVDADKMSVRVIETLSRILASEGANK